MSGKIKVTLKKSTAGQLKNIQQSVRGSVCVGLAIR